MAIYGRLRKGGEGISSREGAIYGDKRQSKNLGYCAEKNISIVFP